MATTIAVLPGSVLLTNNAIKAAWLPGVEPLLNDADDRVPIIAGALSVRNNNVKPGVLPGALYLENARNLSQVLCGSLLTTNNDIRAAILPGSLELLEGAFIYLNAGNFTIAWHSRNRFETGFNLPESTVVTDDADFRQFRIEVSNVAGTLLRTVEQAGKSWTYTTAMQTADGGPYTYYRVRIYQDSDLYQGHKYEFHIVVI